MNVNYAKFQNTLRVEQFQGNHLKDKFITLSISIPVTETVNLRLLLSIPVIVVKDLENRISSSYSPELKMVFFFCFLQRFIFPNTITKQQQQQRQKDYHKVTKTKVVTLAKIFNN